MTREQMQAANFEWLARREYFDRALDLYVSEYIYPGRVIRYGAFPMGWFRI